MRILMFREEVSQLQRGGLGKHIPVRAYELQWPRHEVDLLGNADNADEVPEQFFLDPMTAFICRDFVLQHEHCIALRSFAVARHSEGVAE